MPGPRISFARTLVTGVSRQLTNDEHWILYYFEEHASQCPLCYNPAAVQKSGRTLCDVGRDLACRVAALLFRLHKDGHVYAEEEEQFVRVEMPAKYEHVAGLFKAVQASKSNILARPPSLDAHYPVRPRIPVGGAGHGYAHDNEFDYHSYHYDARAAQQALPRTSSPRRSSPRSSARWSRESQGSQGSQGSGSSARWSRGSLFDDDQRLEQQRELREKQIRYRHAAPQVRKSSTWD
jgi:hypothetical protein